MRKLIIVVDDDLTFLRSVERLLEANGFAVEAFDTVAGFLGCARLRHASCLVLDIHLNGTSGNLRRRLTRSGVLLPVIFMTDDENEATHKAALEAGCVAYLRKPFPASQLIRGLAHIVGQNVAAS